MDENNKKQTIIEAKIPGRQSYIILHTPKCITYDEIMENTRYIYLEYMNRHTGMTCTADDLKGIMDELCRRTGWEWTPLVPNLTMTFAKL